METYAGSSVPRYSSNPGSRELPPSSHSGDRLHPAATNSASGVNPMRLTSHSTRSSARTAPKLGPKIRPLGLIGLTDDVHRIPAFGKITGSSRVRAVARAGNIEPPSHGIKPDGQIGVVAGKTRHCNRHEELEETRTQGDGTRAKTAQTDLPRTTGCQNKGKISSPFISAKSTCPLTWSSIINDFTRYNSNKKSEIPFLEVSKIQDFCQTMRIVPPLSRNNDRKKGANTKDGTTI